MRADRGMATALAARLCLLAGGACRVRQAGVRGLATDRVRYYGGGGDARFGAFLCSLGLRQRDGTPKQAWGAFQQGAAQLGRG